MKIIIIIEGLDRVQIELYANEKTKTLGELDKDINHYLLQSNILKYKPLSPIVIASAALRH